MNRVTAKEFAALTPSDPSTLYPSSKRYSSDCSSHPFNPPYRKPNTPSPFNQIRPKVKAPPPPRQKRQRSTQPKATQPSALKKPAITSRSITTLNPRLTSLVTEFNFTILRFSKLPLSELSTINFLDLLTKSVEYMAIIDVYKLRSRTDVLAVRNALYIIITNASKNKFISSLELKLFRKNYDLFFDQPLPTTMP